MKWPDFHTFRQSKEDEFTQKYKNNPCPKHNHFADQHHDCYGTHCDYWTDMELDTKCTAVCYEWARDYVTLQSIEWKNSIMSNLCRRRFSEEPPEEEEEEPFEMFTQ